MVLYFESFCAYALKRKKKASIFQGFENKKELAFRKMSEERVLFNLERLTNFVQTNIMKTMQYSAICRYEVLTLDGYITAQEAAEKWGVTSRQVQILCKENRVPGASRMSRIWIIPENAKKPTGIRQPKERRTD